MDSSRCWVYSDYRNIWTLEMVEGLDESIPILNIITFTDEEGPLRPEQIHIYNTRGLGAKVEKFAIDTGVDGDPYLTNYLKVLKNSFFGMDLKGTFSGFDEPDRVAIEFLAFEYSLQGVDCMDYEMLAERISHINLHSPDIREDFAILKIPHLGKKAPVRIGRR